MEEGVLTPEQLKFLELVQKEPQITKRFYLAGGTALSAFYLKHRLSHDLDFFCEKEEVDPKVIESFLRKNSKSLLVDHIERSQFLGLFSFMLVFKDKKELKVDFSYYPFPRISKGVKYKNLEVDSLYDIAVNKLHTLFMKPRGRDYVDLYFVMQEKKEYGLGRLILDAKAKFDWDIDPMTLASQFIRARDFEDMPVMLKPFEKSEMEGFFLDLSESLTGKILK